jgi:serine/threonine protein phosphatase PrpC
VHECSVVEQLIKVARSSLSEDEIKKVVMGNLPLDQACQALVDAANAAGGPDNITAILVHLPG